MNTPRKGTNKTKIDHNALAKPPMSWLRKMSANTRNRSMIQANQRKKMSIVQNRPRMG